MQKKLLITPQNKKLFLQEVEYNSNNVIENFKEEDFKLFTDYGYSPNLDSKGFFNYEQGFLRGYTLKTAKDSFLNNLKEINWNIPLNKSTIKIFNTNDIPFKKGDIICMKDDNLNTVIECGIFDLFDEQTNMLKLIDGESIDFNYSCIATKELILEYINFSLKLLKDNLILSNELFTISKDELIENIKIFLNCDNINYLNYIENLDCFINTFFYETK